jgi:hypothetical protein
MYRIATRFAAVLVTTGALLGLTASCANAAPVPDTTPTCAPLPTCTGTDAGSLADMLRARGTITGSATVTP